MADSLKSRGNIVQCPQCGTLVHIYKNPFLTVDVIIDDGKGRILLIERKNPPYGWAIPGGFVDYGESVENAALREILEETGLNLENIAQFRVYSDPQRDPRHHTVTVVFVATIERGSVPKASDDAVKCEFFLIDHLPQNIAFDHRNILEDYRTWKMNSLRS